MAVVIQSSLDDKATIAAFDRIGKKAAETGKKVEDSGKQSAEGLGFITSTLGRLSPGLNFVGEATTKQLPTLIKYGDALKQWGLAGGAVAATAYSVASIAIELGKARKETVQANGATDEFLQSMETLTRQFSGGMGPGMVIGWLHRMIQGGNEELERERRDLEKTQKMSIEFSKEHARADSLRESARQANVQLSVDTEVSHLGSVQEINKALKEQDRIIGKLLTQDGNRKLTEQESADIAAKTNALIARRKELLQEARAASQELTAAKGGYTAAFADADAREQLDAMVEKLQTVPEIESEIERIDEHINELQKQGKDYTEDYAKATAQVTALKAKAFEIAKSQRELEKQQFQEFQAAQAQDRQRRIDFNKNLKTIELQIARDKQLWFMGEKDIRRQILNDQKELDRLEKAGIGNQEKKLLLQQGIADLKKKEADIEAKKLQAANDELKQRFSLFAAKDKDRAADLAAVGGDKCNCDPKAMGGKGGGWQQWGGPVRMPQLQDFRGGQGGQGLGRWAGGGGGPVAGGGNAGGAAGDDFFAELFGAGNGKQAGKDVRKEINAGTKKLFKDKLKKIDDDFQEAMDDIDWLQEIGEYNAADAFKARRNATKGRGNAVKNARDQLKGGQIKQEATTDAMGDAAGDAANALGGVMGLTEKQTEQLRKLTAEAVDAQREQQNQKQRLDNNDRILDAMQKNARFRGQQAGRG